MWAGACSLAVHYYSGEFEAPLELFWGHTGEAEAPLVQLWGHTLPERVALLLVWSVGFVVR